MRHAIQGWATRWPGGAQQLVGGRDSLSVPPGEIAGAWLIRQNLADLFIGYAHYGPALATCDDLRTLTIPAPWNIRCDYQLARLRADPAALALYRFILDDVGQGYLRQAGFYAVQRRSVNPGASRGNAEAAWRIRRYRQAVRLPEMRFAQHVGGLARQPPPSGSRKQRMAGHL
ncbi:Molybdenum-binding periplasmic protein [Klebsiella pneumoniae]|uniref:Molybdenum-binding periplasmic protein n=1 Tax=Klebsiella pneumoniae TaxID=573 RepID=A0A2X1QWJ3_KLEPN|nr:Molybdenum-binding periplasmic protein [Klebsiella pneumoniae]